MPNVTTNHAITYTNIILCTVSFTNQTLLATSFHHRYILGCIFLSSDTSTQRNQSQKYSATNGVMMGTSAECDKPTIRMNR